MEKRINVLRSVVPCLALLLSCGCAANLEGLSARLRSQEWGEAVAEVRGDRAMESHLAALILEEDARQGGDRAQGIVGVLAAATGPGEDALERMAAGEGPVARLAWVALHRSGPLSERKLGALLEDQSSDVRAAAATAWGRRLEPRRLERMLLDKEPRVRAVAAMWLGERHGDAETARLLAEALRLDPDPAVRAAVARRGDALGGRALELLRDASRDESMGVRHAAMRGLAALGTGEAVALLEDLAAGPMDESTVVAAAHLAGTGSKEGRRRFAEALSHPGDGVRATALLHLEAAGTSNPEEVRLDKLEDESPQVVIIAAAALSRLESASEAVSEALRRVRDEGGTRADQARDMLASLGDPEAVAAVSRLFADADEAAIVEALTRLRRAPALWDGLVELMGDSRRRVRVGAAACLLASNLPRRHALTYT